MTKIYLYAGYYELYITDKPMTRPYVLVSWHKSVEAAERAAEKTKDSYFFQEDLLPEELNFALEDENTKICEIQGRNFVIA